MRPTDRMITIIRVTMTPNKLPLYPFYLSTNRDRNKRSLHRVVGSKREEEDRPKTCGNESKQGGRPKMKPKTLVKHGAQLMEITNYIPLRSGFARAGAYA